MVTEKSLGGKFVCIIYNHEFLNLMMKQTEQKTNKRQTLALSLRVYDFIAVRLQDQNLKF